MTDRGRSAGSISREHVTSASAARSNAMVRRPAIAAAGNGSIVSTNFERLFEQMSSMQDQITSLTAVIRSMQSDSPPSEARGSLGGSATATYGLPSKQRTVRQARLPRHLASVSAKSSLEQRGIVEHHEQGDGDLTQVPSPSSSSCVHDQDCQAHPIVDPLWALSKEEALRLCQVYHFEMGIMYPVLELEELQTQVHLLYDFRDRPVGLPTASKGRNSLEKEDVFILRLVFACALTAEASGRSDKAIALFDSVRDVQDDYVWGRPEIKSIIFLTLASILYFQMDEETLAWRTIGIVERMCLEKGLHRRETLSQPAIVAAGKERVLRLFWSIYVLDMRWSFGTGMPFALEDADIDPWLPEPEQEIPYLRVMIRYSRIAAKVWKFISAFNNTNEIKKDEMNYLDWQVLQWAQTLPDSLSSPELDAAAKVPRSMRRLRAMLYLRANQLRMLIHRPVLHTASHIMRYPGESETVVSIAKDTIRFITRLNETSDIYKLQQVTFNWFLVSALAVVFLAASQAPSQFSGSCKEEFYWALELVKGFSTKSYISQRLWKSIRSLRKLGPQVGLGLQKLCADGDKNTLVELHERPSDNQESSLAAAGLSLNSQTPLDGAQMTHELMEWFEAFGNIDDQGVGLGSGAVPEDMPWQQMPNGSLVFDYGGELSTLMKDCF
ncbi:hypothetical protein N7468_007795 [Penicillium chermesinum]|uniref:Xylanolytic transcriptional activator regulatory domain-containing protein n=1 Tax=Penicillium chermesinum TaxID=63820 RepID=A0A9W9NQW8_9EURO|nr:uncharacterized protein N7468_007795 [Penicillium chermesinum]KAJ5223253.1 hypothetical protein N7468_007795 [Penicillium chermesinum]